MAKWGPERIGDQSGRVAVVTGANSGLGLIAARELARTGTHVVLGCRTDAKAAGARDEIVAAAGAASLEPAPLDLADLGSVREFAERVRRGHERLDLLINNAGVMMPPRSETADGFELQLGTNHLGHFALTGLLLEPLDAGAARVVTVSSIEHKPGRIDFDDLQSESGYSPRGAYQRSKLANVLFGLELDRRLRAAGSPVASVLAHPGYSATNLQSTGPTGLMQGILWISNRIAAQSAERGAQPILFAATDPGVEGGQFIGPDGFMELRGAPTVVHPSRRARDAELARRLWQVSEQLTGVRYDLPPVGAGA